ncbi:hypothetical protein Q1695_014525 [Nippostrongylus brasiliensis]|nr:hypothetical protein Q1695_014525 [Nippostrongylus brasiliensis]
MLKQAKTFKHTRFDCGTRGDDSLRGFYLNVHNTVRLRLARGNSLNFHGEPFSSSKNMYKLRWSCLLEEIAQIALSSCDADINGYRSYGINLATFSVSDSRATSSQIDWKETIRAALISWFSEAKKSRWNSPENRFTTANISFFANMVHSKTTEVGCAHQLCTGKIQIACIYNRLGTFMNTTIWRTGNPCQEDADCTLFPNSTCGGIGKEKGLCLTKQEDPDDGKSSICKGKTASPNMTDSVRQKFLKLHNHYRSLVARGKAYDKILGRNVPTASKMQKLKYTCRLEETAWKNNAGENLYRNSIPGFDKIRVASMATEDWFEESEDFGIGGAPVFSAKIAANAGHYTQARNNLNYT